MSKTATDSSGTNYKPPWIMKAKSSFIHSLISSQLNTRYIQPHYPLSDNIVSHSIPFSQITLLYHAFKRHGITTTGLQTLYYDLDKVFSVVNRGSKTIKQFKVIYRNDYQIMDYSADIQTTLEYVGENQFLLNNDTFQVKKNYHHVRQMLLFAVESAHFNLEIEVLLEGLDTYDKRKHLFKLFAKPELVDDPAILGSCSFRFIVKDGMIRDELAEHVDTLQEIVTSSA